MDFSRQDVTVQLSADRRAVLRKKRIVLVGVGGLGSAVLSALVRSGAERFLLFDDDVVSESNLPRQSLFSSDDVGSLKVEVAKRWVLGLQPRAEVLVVTRRFDGSQRALLKDADIVLDCTDNLSSRKVLGQVCADLGLPWVHAAVNASFGEIFAVFPHQAVAFEKFFLRKKSPDRVLLHQGVLSVAVFLTGSFQAVVALRVLLGDASAVRGRLFRLDAWSLRLTSYALFEESSR